jgi:hypothetical protein
LKVSERNYKSQRVRMLAGFMEVAEAIGSDDGIATAKRNIVLAKSRLKPSAYEDSLWVKLV